MQEFTIQTITDDIQDYMRRESLICAKCLIEIPQGERNRTPVPHYYGHLRPREAEKNKYFWWGHFRVILAGVMGYGSYAAEVFEPATSKSTYRLTISYKVQGKWKDFRIYDPEFR